jgi:acetyl-CoA acetyltransferase
LERSLQSPLLVPREVRVSLNRKAAVVGIGETTFELSKNSTRSEWSLAIEAVQAALTDAGIEAREIDGLVRYGYDEVTQDMLVNTLGIRDLRFYCDAPFGGVAAGAIVANAAAAIASGVASTVVIYRSLSERPGKKFTRDGNSSSNDSTVWATGQGIPYGQFSRPFGFLAPGQAFAMTAQRCMYEAGITQDQLTTALSRVAIQQRTYANNNPRAVMFTKPLDLETYRSARVIATPLRLYDLCLETAGAVALVLTSAERARSLRDDPVYVLAAHQTLFEQSQPVHAYTATLLNYAAPGNVGRLFADAGLTPKDISVAELYDAATILVPIGLEVFGFAEPGTAWRHVTEQGIGLDSPLPVNTHGGLLSEAYIHGVNHISEAVRQLRGTAENQVENAETALVAASSSFAILGR